MSKNKDNVELSMTTTQPNAGALAQYSDDDLKSWGGNAGSANDVILPALHLCQQMSDFVTDNLAKMGDFVDITTKENLGNKLTITPFHMEKSWTVDKMNDKGKWEYVRTEKMTAETESLPYEFAESGLKMRRIYTYRFYVLIPGRLLPYTLKLKSSSREAGKMLYTEAWVKNLMKRMPPPAYQFELTSEIEKSEDSKYAVARVTKSKENSHDTVMEAFQWLQTVRRDDVVVVDDKDF
jgi:hypothetical protein